MWTAIVIIVIVTTIGRVLGAGHHRRRTIGYDQQAQPPALPPAPDPALEREVADLRKRLEVLERIATEDRKTRQLADEIERLR